MRNAVPARSSRVSSGVRMGPTVPLSGDSRGLALVGHLVGEARIPPVRGIGRCEASSVSGGSDFLVGRAGLHRHGDLVGGRPAEDPGGVFGLFSGLVFGHYARTGEQVPPASDDQESHGFLFLAGLSWAPGPDPGPLLQGDPSFVSRCGGDSSAGLYTKANAVSIVSALASA